MNEKTFACDRLKARDVLFAALLGVVFTVIYLIFSPKGMEPALWDDMCVASGLRPPAAIFPGLWRAATAGLLKLVGLDYIVTVLRIVGCVFGGLCTMMVYLITRQVLAYLSRTKEEHPWTAIAELITILATICFGTGDAILRVVSPITPGAMRLLALFVVVHLFFRWLYKAGLWRLFLAMFISGAIAAESTVGLLLPLFIYISYRLYLDALVNAKVVSEKEIPARMMMPKWRMFFSFVFGLAVFAAINVWTFVAMGGMDATKWGPFEITIHYVMGYYQTVALAATPVGWVLSITFSVFPLIAALVIFPMLCRDNKPIDFKTGLILLFAGVLALLQAGILPYTRLWSFSSGAAEVRSDFLECIFSLCTVITVALAGSCFMIGSQYRFFFDTDDEGFHPDGRRGYFMRNLVAWIIIFCMVPVVFRLYRPAETELRRIVADALRETVRECGDAKYVFTDGRLDSGLELAASQMGSALKPLNMMSGATEWEKYIRTRHFDSETADYDLATTGTAVLLRVWAGERENGMDESATQLGFEFWRRAGKPLPPQSGFVARTKGIDAKESERGVKAASDIAKRLLYISKNFPHVSASDELKRAVSSISWRISRFARMRDEETLANELDENNDAVKHMMRLIEHERLRTFMQLTPYEGLRLALRRADFNEARRYAQTVLQMDPDDPEANFGTGMAYLMEEKLKEAEFYLERTLKERPDEPAVLNNLSIIYRKTKKLDKALEFVKKAHELLPGNEEIKRTLKETERVIQNREQALRSAFDR